MTRARDPLAREITQQLAPIVAPAAEKADLLIEELAKRHDGLTAFTPRGLGDAVKRLQRQLTAAEIRAGADALMARMKREYGLREDIR